MNQVPDTSWSPMVSGADEFANFLEFSDLQLDFPAFDPGLPDGDDLLQADFGGPDTNMESGPGMMIFDEGDIHQRIDPNLMQPENLLGRMDDLDGSTDSVMDPNAQAQMLHGQQRQRHQQYPQRSHVQGRYAGRGMVPLTPNSVEMHGNHLPYYTQMDPQAQGVFDHYSQKQQSQMVFTPLLSPAVTPLDTQVRIREYTTPGEYFTPLTSPALEAQNQYQAAQLSFPGTLRGSDTSDTASPIDTNVELNPPPAISNTPLLRKPRKKITSAASKPSARAVKQSPAMKPQSRRKQASSTVIPAKEVAEIIEDARRLKQVGQKTGPFDKLTLPRSQASSGADSVSPEPLLEVLMPPPATPRPESASKSPYLKGQLAGSLSAPLPAMSSAPATPASLMHIQKPASNKSISSHQLSHLKEQTLLAEAEMEQIMENIALPEPVKSTKPVLSPLQISNSNDGDTTPAFPAKGQTRSVALNSAPSSATSPIFPSPQLGAVASPSAAAPSTRADARPAARSKKRNSSSQASPALRPRISPSIKPLLPEGTPLSASTTALLLASKSNYQNILEGNHLPGVSYPSNLATNLTSKRTSHKIAEQGRRNRINTALGEIAALLPAGMGGSGIEVEPVGKGDGGPGGGGGNSKARTVEAAIEYIRILKGEIRELKDRLEVAEKRDGDGDGDRGEGNGGEVPGTGEKTGMESTTPS